MTTVIYVLVALAIGVGGAVQSSVLGSIGRSRGTPEAVWISLLAGIAGIALVLTWRAAREGSEVSLTTPLDRWPVFIVVALLASILLGLSVRGLPAAYAGAGLFGLAYLAGSAFLVPRVGIAVFIGAQTTGTLIAAVALDHFGALGADPQPVSLTRIAGIAALLAGVALIRWE